MELSALGAGRRICIQCHDNPDADALASGYALGRYFTEEGGAETVRFIYGGAHSITKPNLVMMTELFEIPVRQVTRLPPCDLLIFADCQPGEKNVTQLPGESKLEIAVIDHHRTKLQNSDTIHILSNLGSCATVIYDLLRKAEAACLDEPMMTALYYGLYCDTCELKDIFHPLDRDMQNDLDINQYHFSALVNSNLTTWDMTCISKALSSYRLLPEIHTAIVSVETADPNILGIVGDFLEQVDQINQCVSFCRVPRGYKLSARSCRHTTKANDFLEHLCGNQKTSGGHRTKAGGFLPEQDLTIREVEELLVRRALDYFKTYPLIDTRSDAVPIEDMKVYRKKPIPRRAVCAAEILPAGTPLLIRELQEDLEQTSSEELFLVVGQQGETYYMSKEKFESIYHFEDRPVHTDYDYEPTIRNRLTGRSIRLEPTSTPVFPTRRAGSTPSSWTGA